MDTEPHLWQRQDLAKLFLEDVRGSIPLAAEQIDVLLRIVRNVTPTVDCLLDLGCGDGILGRAVMAEYPHATGVFVDFSEHMMDAARQKVDNDRADFFVQDLAEEAWAGSIRARAPFDLVLSGLAIHHLVDERKRALYAEIFHLLKPGGLFLNLEHVAPRCDWADRTFDDLFIDSLWAHYGRNGDTRTREEIADEWHRRSDRELNILAPVEEQCEWLRQIGFRDVDCFFKVFQVALFGGLKPE